MTRVLTPEDARAFVRLRLEGIETFPNAFLLSAEEAISLAEHVPDKLALGTMRGLFDGAHMVGFAGMTGLNATAVRHRASIGPFYVNPSLHGTGAADVLMNAIAQAAVQEGVLQLELWVWEGNARALAFYQRHGFVRQGRLARAVILDDLVYDDVFLVRPLDA